MNILIAPDKLKGTLPSALVAKMIKEALEEARPDDTVTVVPLADGGDGTLEAFGGANMRSLVTGPAGTKVEAAWIMDEEHDRAIIESASASGLVLVGGKDHNDPIKATSAGTGELIVQAVSKGAKHIIIGIGGSAMTDGGRGCLEALEGLDMSYIDLEIASDVDTLFEDAAKVFGPQKGATPDQVEFLTQRLTELRGHYLDHFGIDVGEVPGGGAAGGLGGALYALGAHFHQGFDLIAKEVGFYEEAAKADVIITAEGHLDSTSFVGKVPDGVLRTAAEHGIPVVIIAGAIADDVHIDQPNVYTLSLTELCGFDMAYTDPEGALTHVSKTALLELPIFQG